MRPRPKRRSMPVISIRRCLYACGLLLMIGWVGPLLACNIPVFRYALERWQADQVEMVVFHDETLSEQHQAVLDKWTSFSTQSSGQANLAIVTPEQQNKSHAEIHAKLKAEQGRDLPYPYVVFRSAIGQGREINFWHGSLEEAQALNPLQSPIRLELRRRLLEGHSIVWLLLKSHDQQLNARTKRLVEGQFESLSNTLALPEGIGLPGSELYADVPLVLRFSLLEFDPNDPAEGFLKHLLTGIRKEEYEDGQPLVIPIFGRGRALEVIPAEEVTPGLVRDLTLFLSGACSCQVKEQNPGFDLLLDAAWDDELFGGIENRPPDRTEAEGKNREPVLVPIAPGRK